MCNTKQKTFVRKNRIEIIDGPYPSFVNLGLVA